MVSARLGSARLGSARLGSARLGSARLGSALLLIAVSVGCGANNEDEDPQARPSLRACEQLRDHLIDVRLAGASGLDATAMTAQRSALHTSMGTEFTAACQRTMVRTTVQCALAASDGLGLAECEAKGKTR